MITSIDNRIVERFQAQMGFDLEKHLIVLALMGSHSHGTYVPPTDPSAIDDVDLMGFIVPPLDYHLGLPNFEHWRLQEEELDVVLYSLDKAVRLLLKGNPNILGMLWLRDEQYVHRTEVFNDLLECRRAFVSQVVGHSFSGYAYGQLQRMTHFNLRQMDKYEHLSKLIESRGPLKEVLEADANKLKHIAENWDLSIELLKEFRKVHQNHFSGYMGDKRKHMVRQFGYDVKNASHLIRLLRMGKEFLETGELNVYRTTDAEELMQIKKGAWTLDQVKEEAEILFNQVGVARGNSKLPPDPDYALANDLLIGMQMRVLNLASII